MVSLREHSICTIRLINMRVHARLLVGANQTWYCQIHIQVICEFMQLNINRVYHKFEQGENPMFQALVPYDIGPVTPVIMRGHLLCEFMQMLIHFLRFRVDLI